MPEVPEPHGRADDAAAPVLGRRAAAALVFGTSAAVLVVEITALRLLAPYLGLTLETSTAVIALALGAIALGSWAGGRSADRVDARRLLGPCLLTSGAVVAVTPAALRTVAEVVPGALVPVAALSILIPGALLSAVTPMVTTLRLRRLADTGAVVGGLSGVGTVGAIAGTVLTGFVLLSRLPVTAILVGLGALLVLGGIAATWPLGAGAVRRAPWALLVVGAGALAGAVAPGGCDVETPYHCLRLVPDSQRADAATLVLDGLRHSYVDRRDPTHLEFSYVRALAAVVDAAWPAGTPLRAQHVGGGGLTLPRWLAATRPGTVSDVSEIDRGVVAVDRDRLGPLPAGVAVAVEDGRAGLRRAPTGSRDLVVGDAFGGVSVPWHLTTAEAMGEVRRILAPGGIYAVNLIDHGDLGFARSHVATLARMFDHVAVLGAPGRGGALLDGGNLVAVASARPLAAEVLTGRLRGRDLAWLALTGDAVDRFVGDAAVLTDDRAPVDQLLTPFRPS